MLRAMTGTAPDRLVTVVETAEVPTAVIAEETTWELFPGRWPVLLDEVWKFVRRAGLAAGRNVMLYRDDVPHVEVGVELASLFASDGRVVPSALPAGRAARAVAVGPPSARTINDAHDAVVAWCEANGWVRTGCRWEVYAHWADDQNPDAYEIEVFWQLA
jgi:hypothetical protein